MIRWKEVEFSDFSAGELLANSSLRVNLARARNKCPLLFETKGRVFVRLIASVVGNDGPRTEQER